MHRVCTGCSSRFTIASTARYPAGTIYVNHHSVGQVVVVERGTMRWRYRGATWDLPALACAVVLPGHDEQREWLDPSGNVHSFIHCNFTAGAIAAWERLAPPPCRRLSPANVIAPLIHHIFALKRTQPPGWQEAATYDLRALLAAYLSDCTHCVPTSLVAPLPSLVADALRVLRDRWRADGMRVLPLRDWAGSLGCSVAHLNRIFRRALGTTPGAAQQMLRAHYAVHMLTQTDLSMKEVKAAIGMPGASQFCHLLQRFYGIPPSRIRSAEPAHLFPPQPVLRMGEWAALFWER